MLYITDIDKLTPDVVRDFLSDKKDASLLVFCKEDSTVSLQTHIALQQTDAVKFQITDGSDIQKAFYAGIACATETDVCFCKGCTLEGKITLPGQPQPKTKKTRKTTASCKTEEEAAAEPEKPKPAPRKRPAATTKPQSKPSGSQPSGKNPGIWLTEGDRELFGKLCAIPEQTKDRQELLDDIAVIIHDTPDVNHALVAIKTRHGKETASLVAKNINLLASTIRNGYGKRVEKVICP